MSFDGPNDFDPYPSKSEPRKVSERIRLRNEARHYNRQIRKLNNILKQREKVETLRKLYFELDRKVNPFD